MTWFRNKPPNANSLIEVNRTALQDLFEKARISSQGRRNACGMLAHAVAEDDDRDAGRMNADYATAMRRFEQSAFSVDTHTLDLFFLCDRMIKRVAETRKRGTDETDSAGPEVGDARFGEVVRATVNNGRHYHESGWNASPPTGKPKSNIDILERAGVEPPWNRLVAHDVFKIMDFQSYEDFERQLRATLTALETPENSLTTLTTRRRPR